MRLTDEQLRGLLNAGQLYEGWKDVLVQLANMPGGMYWRVINSKEYLYQYVPGPVGLQQQTKFLCPRTPQAEDAYCDFRERKEALVERRTAVEARIQELVPVSRPRRNPQVDRTARR